MYTNATKEVKKIKILFQDLVTNLPIFHIKFFSWNTIIEIKKVLQKRLNTNHHNIRLFYKNIELNKNGKRIMDFHIKNRQIITIKMIPRLENSLGILNPYQIFEQTPRQILQMFQNINNGFRNGTKPKLTENGTSGSYFLQSNTRKNVAIFKPFDQQPFAPNNPRNYIGNLGDIGFRKGILSGQSATRQVAAYILNDNYHGVPATTYVQFYHPLFTSRQHEPELTINSETQFHLKKGLNTKIKHGSLQAFIISDDVIGNYGHNIFSVQQIHKIAILDLRILNCDRNEQNILVKKEIVEVQTSNGIKLKKEYKLIPIDHGLSFPDNLEIYDYQVIWMNYNQSKQPFTQKQLKFIQSIDPIADVKKLRQKLGFRQICIRNFRIAQILLKKAAKLGFNINQIGHMLYRKQLDQQDTSENVKQNKNISEIQKLVAQTQNIYFFVKQNGIKSTIQYRIGLIKERQNFKIIKRNSPKLIQIKQKDKQESEEESPKLNNKNHHINPFHLIKQKQHRRSISLPNNKKTLQTNNHHKWSEKEEKNEKNTNGNILRRENTNEIWEEIFYHYFEDILDRYLKQKKKNKKRRERSNSEFIQ